MWESGRLLSTVLAALLAVLALSLPARAHEVLPAIADMEVVEDRLEFSVRANLESFVAGIDLDGLADTNEAAEAEDYDVLRELPPEDLEARFRAYWPEMEQAITVRAGGADLPLTLTGVDVPPVGDAELVRPSTFTFTAPLPQFAESVEVGWESRLGVLVLRQQGVEAPYDGYLEGGTLSDPISLSGGDQASGWMTFLRYIPVGFDHIVPLGLDHILFVLGLFFLAPRIGPLLWQISAFTLAHTITLALAALGYVTVPASVVEPLIALSIVYVAVENIFSTRLSPWRPAVVFGFGLLHGLGFASVLREFGLPDGTFIPALIGFNIGVEVGQICVVALAYILCLLAIRQSNEGVRSLALAAGYLVLAFVLLPFLVIPAQALGEETFGALLPLIGAAMVLAGLCGASAANDRFDTYRFMVAMPASILIAGVGSWWVVERVFL